MECHPRIRGGPGMGIATESDTRTVQCGSGSVPVHDGAEECAIYAGWTYNTAGLDDVTDYCLGSAVA